MTITAPEPEMYPLCSFAAHSVDLLRSGYNWRLDFSPSLCASAGRKDLGVSTGPTQDQVNVFRTSRSKVLQESDSRHEHDQRQDTQLISRQVEIWEDVCSSCKFRNGAIGFYGSPALWTRLFRRQVLGSLRRGFASTSTPRRGISEIISESRPTKWDVTHKNMWCNSTLRR